MYTGLSPAHLLPCFEARGQPMTLVYPPSAYVLQLRLTMEFHPLPDCPVTTRIGQWRQEGAGEMGS